MEKQKILKNFAVIGAGTFLNLLLGVITTPIITRIVDPVEYGQLSIFTMYEGIAVMVLCLGLDQALVRYYYREDTAQYHRSLLFHCIYLPIIISALSTVVVILLSVTGIVQFEFDTTIMILLCLYVFIQLIYRFSRMLVRLSFQSKLYSLLSVIEKIAYVTIALLLIFLIRKNYLLLLVIATVAAYFICMIVSIAAQKETWSLKAYRTDHYVLPITQKELFLYAYPYIFSMGITTLFQAIDKISLNHFCTYREVGVYSSAMTLIHVFAIIQTTFNTLWTPMAVEHYTNDPEDKAFYQKGNQIITVIMFFIGLTLILTKDVFALFLGSKYREAAYILPFLIFNPIMYTISETTVSGLIFMKKSSMQIIAGAGACLANLIGNTILVPIYGPKGAAISTGLSYILFFALRTILSNKYFPVDFSMKKFSILTVATCGYALYNTFIGFNWVSVAGYAAVLILMIALYHETIHMIIKDGRQFVKETVLKKNNGATECR